MWVDTGHNPGAQSDALTRAEAARAAMARLLAVAGHDLKQPVHVAMMSIARAVDEVADPGAARRLRIATEALRRLGRDLDDLARASQADHTSSHKKRPVELGDLFAELKEEWVPYAEACGVILVMKPRSIVVESDRGMLATILRNLVGNAVKYTPRNGCVTVDALRRRDSIRIEVRDNGPGIEPHRLATIFEAFDRGGREIMAPGLGLGLHIVRQTADALRYRVTVRSRKDAGSIFAVNVPCAVSRPRL